MKRICLLVLTLVASFPSDAQTKGSFIDARDGKKYATVTYTLRFSESVISDLDEYGTYAAKEPVTYEVILTDSTPSSMTWMAQNLNYEMVESKCFKDSNMSCDPHGRLYNWFDSKKACPSGWHLPSDDEWYLLANQYGGVSSAGEHLKNTTLNGTNKSQFDVKKPAIYWSSDEMNTEYAWDWKVNFRWTKLQRWKGGKDAYNSVRCVQDY